MGADRVTIDSYVQKSHRQIIPKQTPQTPTLPPSKKQTILLRGIGNKYLRLCANYLYIKL